MQKITFQELPEFQKDFKRLVKNIPLYRMILN